VFNADGMCRAFLDAMPDDPGEAVTVYTGITLSTAEGGAALRRELGIPLDAPLVGSVGRLVEQKRYDRLIRALPSLPGVHALLVGEGAERETLEALAQEHGVAERLHLTGHRKDVGVALDAMNVFVLCSDREGMSNAMLEALAAGVPVVSTDVSGAREALTPWHDGSCPGRVVGFTEAELAGALRDLLGAPDQRAYMGEAARRIARERFGEERMLDEWERVLRGA